jgi:enoyl-CoA hydratase
MEQGAPAKVLYTVQDHIAWITLNRPEKMNALSREIVQAVKAAATRAIEDADVAVLVLTGAGEKAFVAGADIREMAAMDAREGQSFSRFLQTSFDVLERSPKPVIAAVNGFALGGGCELAMACHLRIAADSARFGQPEVSLGLIPGAGGTQRLQRLVGRGKALELILTGEMISADEAHRIGLVNQVVPAGELRDRVTKVAGSIGAKSPVALARAIDAVMTGGDLGLDDAMRLEASLFGLCFATGDMKEGTSAFLTKRKPEFPGT